MACATWYYFFQTVGCCAWVALPPIPPNPNGRFPFPWIRGYLPSSPARNFLQLGSARDPSTLILAQRLQDNFSDFHPIYTNFLTFFLLPSATKPSTATKSQLSVAQPASIPQKKKSIRSPVEAGFTLTKILIALPLPGRKCLMIVLLVGILPFVHFPTASFLPGSSHCDLAQVPLTQQGPRTCLTPQEPIYQNSRLLCWVRAVQEPPSCSPPPLCCFGLFKKRTAQKCVIPKGPVDQGRLSEKPLTSLIVPGAISQSQGFTPALGFSALSCNTLKDNLCGTVQRMMVGPIASV